MSFHPDALVLTPDGWKPIHEVELTDKVAELSDDHLVFSNPIDKASRNFSGDLVLEMGRSYGYAVTPDHVLEVLNKATNKLIRIPASDPATASKAFMHTAAPIRRRDREVRDLVFTRLLGLVKATRNYLGRNSLVVRPYSRQMLPYFIACVRNANIPCTVDRQTITMERHPRLLSYMSENGHMRRSTVLALDEPSKHMLLWSFMSWAIRSKSPGFNTVVTRTHEDDRELFFEVGALSGLSIVGRYPKNSDILHLKIRPERWVGRTRQPKKMPYSGRVYHLAMPSGTLLTRFNYHTAFTLDGTATL